ncbi:hypothetical protein ACSDQ9_07050 [Aestuariimicrobium soli]|uniref:hypothetical protein n=1 Tax=Aestuariimicrobium soli TaxID=2035834 RepID=UPI003EBE8424
MAGRPRRRCACWVGLVGIISAERFGLLGGDTVRATDDLFEYQLARLGDQVGLR